MHQRVNNGFHVNESNNEYIMSQKVDQYSRNYGKYLDILESPHCDLNKVRNGNITLYDHFALGGMLEGLDGYIELCEATGTINNLGTLPNVMHDIVTALYANSPIPMIASVQPIQEEMGMVFFKDVKASLTRGNLTKDENISSSDAIGKSPDGYASEEQSFSLATLAADDSAYSGTWPTTRPLPIRKGKVTVNVTYKNGGTAHTTLVAKDYEADGVLAGPGIYGTINYETGAWAVNLANAPTAAGTTDVGQEITLLYAIDQEGQESLQEVYQNFRSKSVNARVYALKSTIGLEQSFVMRRRFGRVAEDDISSDLVSCLNAEILAIMLRKIKNAYTGLSLTPKIFDRASVKQGVSYRDHKDLLKDKIVEMEAEILSKAGRGSANVLLAGVNVCAIIETLPGFNKMSTGMSMGAHLFGTFDGKVVIRFPEAAILPANDMYALYKGTSAWDATICYAPYMPLIMTNAMPNYQNPLQNTKAAAIWAATEMLVPNFLSKTEIINETSTI